MILTLYLSLPVHAAGPLPQNGYPADARELSQFFAEGILSSENLGDLSIVQPLDGEGHGTWSLARDTNCMLTLGAAYAFTPWIELDVGYRGITFDYTLPDLTRAPRLCHCHGIQR